MSRPGSGTAPGRMRGLRKLASFAFVLGCLAVPSTASASQVAAVQTHLMWSQYDTSAVDRQMDRARDAGAGMLRVDVGWASIEADGKGQHSAWYVSKLDHVVDGANARGLKLLLTFWETPCWASSAPADLKQGCAGSWWNRGVQRYAPSNPQDYADALAWAVRRYGNRVAAWEIWNEPNHPDYLKADDPAAAYAPLVRAAYPAAKAADPGTTVVAGSLADADFDFTERLLKLGVGGNFDAWSVHPYSEDRSPLDPGVAGWSQKAMVAGVPRVRDTLLRYGQNRPLWLTEFGWSTCTVRNRRAYENCNDEQAQAQYLREAFNQMQSWSYVQVGVWFNMQDTGPDRSSRLDNYGLLRFDGSAKPAFAAFRDAAGKLQRGLPIRKKPKHIKLKVWKRHRRVYARGSAPEAKTVTIRAYRVLRHRGKLRISRHASYRKVIRVKRSGRFRARLAGRLRHRRWHFVAKARGTRLIAARSSLR
jgi:polysaccharide biosynthesis protein PslG